MTDGNAAGEAGATGTGEGSGSGGGSAADMLAADKTGKDQGGADQGYDSDTKGWLQNRGYNNLDGVNTPAAAALIKQARELEKLRGVSADKLVQLPDDMTQPGALDAVFAKLGRPEEPGKYEFPADPAGEETEFRAWAAPIFHKAGLTNQQANAVYTALKDGAAAEEAAAAEAQTAEQTAALEALKGEWKDSYDLNVQIARSVVQKLGVDTDTINALEGALGNAGVLKLFAKIGGRTGEANFIAGTNPAVAGITSPEAAQQRLRELSGDLEFAKKVQAGDQAASKLITDLSKIAAGASPTSV